MKRGFNFIIFIFFLPYFAFSFNNLTIEKLIKSKISKIYPDSDIEIKLMSSKINIKNTKTIYSVELPEKINRLIVIKLNGYNVKIQVKIFKNVVVSNRVILKGEKIRYGDLRTERRDILKYNFLPVFPEQLNKIIGKISKRVIQKDSVVKLSDFIRKSDVYKGKIIKMLYKSDNICAYTKGICEENGYIGDVIKIRNLKSKKIVYGKVISKKIILVGGE